MAASIKQKMHPSRFSLFPTECNLHPLHLGIGKAAMRMLYPFEENEDAVVAISTISKTGQTIFTELFTKVQVVDMQVETHEAESTVKLFCTRDFLTHYDLTLNSDISIRTVRTFQLSKVILYATSDSTFRVTKSDIFTTALLLSCCQQRILARKGDILLAPSLPLLPPHTAGPWHHHFNLKVFDCEPVSQGLISLNTEIVIIRDEHDREEKNQLCSHPSLLIPPPILSDFTSGLFSSSFSISECVSHTLEPRVIADLQKWNNITNGLKEQNLEIKEAMDVGSCVGLTKNTATQLGLLNESLVSLQIELPVSEQTELKKVCDTPEKEAPSLDTKALGNSDEQAIPQAKSSSFSISRNCTVQVLSSDSKCDDNCIYMSPVLYFNLFRECHAQQPKISITKYLPKSSEPQCSCSPHWTSCLPFAKSIELSLINSPNYSRGQSFDEALKVYFTTTRLVNVGDILALDISRATTYRTGPFSGNVAFFKVSKLDPTMKTGESALADLNHTSLYQGGSCHHYVPVNMETFWCGDSIWASHSIPGLSVYINKLQEIIQPYVLASADGCSEAAPAVLVHGASGAGKTLITTCVARRLGMHLIKVNCHELCGETAGSTEAKIKALFHKAKTYTPCVLLLRNVHALGKDRDGTADDPRVSSFFHEYIQEVYQENVALPIVVIATTSHTKLLSPPLYEGFLHEIKQQVPSEGERRLMLTNLLQSSPCAPSVSFKHIAQRTAGMVLGDLCSLISQAKKAAYTRITATFNSKLDCDEEQDLVSAGISLHKDDFSSALDQLQAAHSDAIGAPKIPNVTWQDVGGLADVKADILDTIQLPLEHPELFSAGLRRSGVLLYGPPGTGKTLLAKAVATECSLNFLSVKGPELINMYVGQSEENVREVFHRARSATPCVIFFDELDSLAPNRGRSGDSGGVMDRVVSQLLAELDGLHKSCDVFVIGATNRPDLLDPALLRPGRFDKLLYLGVSNNRDAQLNVLKALTRKFEFATGTDLERVVEKCPFTMTGADFYALCSDAMLNALKGKIEMLEKGIEVDESEVLVSEEHFLQAISSLIPSVSEQELKRYEQLQQFYKKTK